MIKLIDKFIKYFFNQYVTDYSKYSKIELEVELIGIKNIKFIPNFKNGYWLEGTYIILLAILGLHVYKYFTELNVSLIVKSFIYSLLGITFCRLMIILDKNIRIYRISNQLGIQKTNEH